MHKKATLSFLGAAVLASLPAASHAAELLTNGSFEGPVVTAGQNNLGTAPDSWSVFDANGTVNNATTNKVSNLTRGTVTNGSGNSGSNNLLTDPYDNFAGNTSTNTPARGLQSLDISGAGTVSQPFTAIANAPVTVKFDIGGRDSTSADAGTAGSTWSIFNNTTNALVASSTSALKPAFGNWLTNTSTTTASLVSGTVYRFVITLDNPDQVDGLSIMQVPEPTTAAAASIGLGLLGWLGYKRRRRS